MGQASGIMKSSGESTLSNAQERSTSDNAQETVQGTSQGTTQTHSGVKKSADQRLPGAQRSSGTQHISGNQPNSGDQRLPRKYILRGREAFRLLFRKNSSRSSSSNSSNASSIRTAHLQARFRLTKENHQLLTAFVAPKRVFPRAVDRNKIKRWLREAFRKNRYLLQMQVDRSQTGMHLALIANRPPDSYHIVEKEVISLLRSIANTLSGELRTQETGQTRGGKPAPNQPT
ncbi:MAG: hypothetical protein DA446_07350 [Bacteroidetes bacterium]|nr:MAG: hypothetical protein DA446_07350 [Bacteroidota bacterium]